VERHVRHSRGVGSRLSPPASVSGLRAVMYAVSFTSPEDRRHRKSNIWRQIFGNGATDTSLPRTRHKGGRPITSSLLRNASRQKEPARRALEAVGPASYIPQTRRA